MHVTTYDLQDPTFYMDMDIVIHCLNRKKVAISCGYYLLVN